MSHQLAARSNMEILEDLYQRWRQDPSQVEESWRLFFEGFDLGLAQQPAAPPEGSQQQTLIIQIINSYRRLGHFQSHLDPLSPAPASIPQLDLSQFNFTPADLD